MADTETKTSGAVPEMDTKTALDLFALAGSLNSTLDLDYLLQKIQMAAERLLDSEASSIMLVTDDHKSLFFKMASGQYSSALKTMTLPIGKGIGGIVAQTRQPEIVNDAQNDARIARKFDSATKFRTLSLVCVPMLFQGELVGVVQVLNKRSGPYTQGDLALLTSLASLASVAITNTKIISEQKNFFSHVMEILTGVIETSKSNMAEHPARAAKLACSIGRMMEIDEYDYKMLYYAGILHDVGYTAFRNKRILAEMGALSVSEEIHPSLSAKMLEGIKMIEGAIPMIRHHHENWDGSGYPAKLVAEEIPLGARILGLVEAMEEIYMAGLRGESLHTAALKEAKAGAGTRFSPEVVEAFVALVKTQGQIW